jgi:ferric-dicitrate binding protein FerR (iron transport regulator)
MQHVINVLCVCRCCYFVGVFRIAGATLHLDGIDAFDAATHCAALTAAERISKQQQQAAEEQAQQSTAAPAGQQQQAFDAAATQLPLGGAAASCPGAAVAGPAPMQQ